MGAGYPGLRVTKYTLGFSKSSSYGAEMRTRDHKIALLRPLPMFAGSRTRELRQVAAVAEVVTASAGRVICRADQPALEAYVVVDGTVDVVADGTTLASLERGQLVGELGVLDGELRTADVVAATDVTLLAISGPAFRALVESCPAVRLAALRQLAERLRRMDVALLPV
jgi:CRP-like cAMP-binding protein